jgi:hypothetical protein
MMTYPTVVLPPGVTVDMVFMKNSLPDAGFTAYTFEEALKIGVIKVVSSSPGLEVALCRSSVQVVTKSA